MRSCQTCKCRRGSEPGKPSRCGVKAVKDGWCKPCYNDCRKLLEASKARKG